MYMWKKFSFIFYHSLKIFWYFGSGEALLCSPVLFVETPISIVVVFLGFWETQHRVSKIISNVLYSFVDPHQFEADPGPACHFDADPDPTFYFDAGPNPRFQIKAQNLEKVLK